MTMNGRCTKMMAAGVDITSHCTGSMANTLFSDTRNSFMFSVSNPMLLLSFLGLGSAQVKTDPDTAVQPVDTVSSNIDGKPDFIKAVGYCKFSNPYKAHAGVTCVAMTEEGLYEGVFEYDGKTPDKLRPGD